MLIGIGSYFYVDEYYTPKAITANETFPDISGYEFIGEGNKKASLADYAGKIVVVNFWASWCQPCIKELPELAELKRLHGERLEILAVNKDVNKEAGELREFLKKYNAGDLEIYFDEDNSLGQLVGLRGMPTTLIIDENGKIIQKIEGYFDWRKSILQKMLD